MYGVIERRRQYLHLMRQITLEQGFFTVTNIQDAAEIPRSTAQDWINRLVSEGCVVVKERNRLTQKLNGGATATNLGAILDRARLILRILNNITQRN